MAGARGLPIGVRTCQCLLPHPPLPPVPCPVGVYPFIDSLEKRQHGSYFGEEMAAKEAAAVVDSGSELEGEGGRVQKSRACLKSGQDSEGE